jgi:hypothetical protein
MKQALTSEERKLLDKLIPEFFEFHVPMELTFDTIVIYKTKDVPLGKIIEKVFTSSPEYPEDKQEVRRMKGLLEAYGATEHMIRRNTHRDRNRKVKVAKVSLGRPLGKEAFQRLASATHTANKELKVVTPIGAKTKEVSKVDFDPSDKYLQFTKAIGPHGFAEAVRQVEMHRAQNKIVPEFLTFGATTVKTESVMKTREALIVQGLMDPISTKPKGDLLRRLIAQRDHANGVQARNEKLPPSRSPQIR